MNGERKVECGNNKVMVGNKTQFFFSFRIGGEQTQENNIKGSIIEKSGDDVSLSQRRCDESDNLSLSKGSEEQVGVVCLQ